MKSKSRLVNQTRQKDALTANNAVTHSTSLNNVIDLFFIAGASRNISDTDIENMLEKAWSENSILTLKCIFWAGDIRGGAGERRFFRVALKWLKKRHPDTFNKNFKKVPEYNRWDSLFLFNEKPVLDYIYKALTEEKNNLCAKWMPRKKQYDNFASTFRKTFNLTPKEYRKMIVKLSNTVEQKMCNKEWDEIEYPQVPSVAMNKYRQAFLRHDKERFNMYIEDVQKGKEKINAGAIFPHDILKKVISLFTTNIVFGGNVKINKKELENPDAIVAQWNNLPNYMKGNREKILPICDVSGSMFCMHNLPISISLALGLYLSERNEGLFKDAFITFSENPKMEYLKGDFYDRVQQLASSEWGMNTNLTAVFQLILNRAVKNHLTPKEMPDKLLIISDMEFDSCSDLTNYEQILREYASAGYKVPKIIFWNVNGRPGNVPVCSKTKNVALVSGASPTIMTSILGGEDFSPESVMKKTLKHDRYKEIIL